jgi:hypothetical protein
MIHQIDILYMQGCQDWEVAAELLRQVVADLGIEAEFNYYLIENDRQAIETFFTGSPSIRFDDYDLFPEDMEAVVGLRLRSYVTPEGVLGHPTYEMLVEALQAAIGAEGQA